MAGVQGAPPHSTACQIRYLSASNRGTGEDRQHLLSKPNYLLSTKQEKETGASARRADTHAHSLIYFRLPPLWVILGKARWDF